MSDAATMTDTRDIVVDEVFPHAPEIVWKTLTTAELMGRWLMMPTGFEPTKGKHFTFQTTPAGEWDGIIHCQVLEVTPNERLVYAWRGGHDANAEYGSRTPKNDFAFKNMSEGWPKVFQRIDIIAGEHDSSKAKNPNG